MARFEVRVQQRSPHLASSSAVVVKRAVDDAARSRLAHEATQLRLARHPGVVELVELVNGPSGCELVTGHAGSLTLAEFVAPNPSILAAVLGGLAETVADLHDLGVSHGALAGDHVIVSKAHLPVLCSFGRARPAEPDARRGDLDAYLALAAEAADAAASGATRRERRIRRAVLEILGDAAMSGVEARTIAARLATVGRLAPDGDPRRAAGGVALATVGARHDGGERTRTWHDRVPPHDSIDPPPSTGRARSRVLVAVGVVTALTAVVCWRGSIPWRATGPGARDPARLATPRIESTAAFRCVHVDPSATCAFPTISSNVVTVGDRRFEAGEPSDRVLVGDWRCDGAPTALVVRPDGSVHLFDRWPSADTPALASLVARTAAGAPVDVRRVAGCDVLMEGAGRGSPRPVELG